MPGIIRYIPMMVAISAAWLLTRTLPSG
jgi:hypothetical protein